jgi:hypothetical protein
MFIDLCLRRKHIILSLTHMFSLLFIPTHAHHPPNPPPTNERTNQPTNQPTKTGPEGSNTHLQSLSASGHAMSLSSLTLLGKAISMGASRRHYHFKHLAIGNASLGDEGVVALCHGLAMNSPPDTATVTRSSSTATAGANSVIATSIIPLETLDLSRKGM